MKKKKSIPFEVESFRKPHLGENTEKKSMKERCNKTSFKGEDLTGGKVIMSQLLYELQIAEN